MERGTGLVLQPAKLQKLPSTPFHPATLPDLRSDLLDLTVFQLDRRCAAENRDCNFEAGAGLVDFLDDTAKGSKRTIRDADILADLEHDGRLRTINTLRDLPLAPRKPVTFGVFLIRW